MMNPYTCDKCDWTYAWTLGDRVKAVKRHQLAHLLEQRLKSQPNFTVSPSLIDFIDQRLQTADWSWHGQ